MSQFLFLMHVSLVILNRFTEPLKRFSGGKEVHERWDVSKLPATSDTQQKDKSFSSWGISKETNCPDILRKMFSQFVGEVIERMAGYIPLPAIMAKLLADNGNQEFGDFKFTILKMLGTYGYERRILVIHFYFMCILCVKIPFHHNVIALAFSRPHLKLLRSSTEISMSYYNIFDLN